MRHIFGAILSKAAALAILAAIIAGGANFIVRPLADRLQNARDHISEQRALLGRLEQSAAIDKKIATEGGQNTARKPGTFLPGENDAIRLSGLQSVLNDTAEAATVRIASIRALDPSDIAGLKLLSVQAQFSANLDQLQKMLFSLEKQHSNLVVDQLHIARSPQAPGQGLPALDVTFVLSGAAPAQKAQP